MGDFHHTLLKDRSITIFYPKLDNCTPYEDITISLDGQIKNRSKVASN
jgi:hypothetical protein